MALKVGNAKYHHTYSPEDKAFHSSDIPDAARQARLEAKAWKRPKILGGHRPSWNAQVSTEKPICERVSATLIDTSLRSRGPSRDSTTPSESSSAGWNSSTQLTLKEVQAKVWVHVAVWL